MPTLERSPLRTTKAVWKGPEACIEHKAGAVPRRVCREKKRLRALEQLRPDVAAKRAAFKRRMRKLPANRLVFLDESGLNASMTRSHAWVRKGTEFVEQTPMNWGKNLTLLGAMRLTGWVLLSTMFETTNKDRFVAWLVTKLLTRLTRGDILVLDNLKAHHDSRVTLWRKQFGVRLLYLPPYSHDFNPIEAGWGRQKQYVRKHAPRTSADLVRVARRARHHRITPRHCRNWFAHAGYSVHPN